MPPLSEAIGTLVTDHREYLGSLPTTFGEILVSYAIACGGGIVLGQLVGASATARRMLLPVLRSAYAVPLVVLYPVMMVWFGLGSQSKIAFASIYAFIPTMLTAVAGRRRAQSGARARPRAPSGRPAPSRSSTSPCPRACRPSWPRSGWAARS